MAERNATPGACGSGATRSASAGEAAAMLTPAAAAMAARRHIRRPRLTSRSRRRLPAARGRSDEDDVAAKFRLFIWLPCCGSEGADATLGANSRVLQTAVVRGLSIEAWR